LISHLKTTAPSPPPSPTIMLRITPEVNLWARKYLNKEANLPPMLVSGGLITICLSCSFLIVLARLCCILIKKRYLGKEKG